MHTVIPSLPKGDPQGGLCGCGAGLGSTGGSREGVHGLVLQAAATGRMLAWEVLLRDPFPFLLPQAPARVNPSHKFFKVHLETSQAICSAGHVPGFVVHQKCRVCLFF